MPKTLRKFPFKAMGCACEVQLFDDSRINAKFHAQKLFEEAWRLENKYSRYKQDSFLSNLNSQAGNHRGVAIDAESLSLLDHAKSCFEQSEGAFDITAGRLSRLWDFKLAEIPTSEKVEEALHHTGFNKLTWRQSRLVIPDRMEIDFGGIVKEYAADSMANLARKLGCASGLINLGGDFAVIGPHIETGAWPIGVSNPENPEIPFAALDIGSGGLATSGDYERYFQHQGVRYSHLINPTTGWPNQGLRAVSVAGNLCTIAGSVSTIAMLKTQSEGIEWLSQTTLPHVYMKQDGTVGGS